LRSQHVFNSMLTLFTHTHSDSPYGGPFELLFALLQRARDGGPIYAESDFSQTIVEPMNALSAALFLGIVGWYFWKLRGRLGQHVFLRVALPILAIGGIGGTIYHAFRLHRVWLMMDWLPIAILCIAASVYFMLFLVPRWWHAVLLLLGVFVVQGGIMFTFVQLNGGTPPQFAINLNYSLMGMAVATPILLYLRKRRWQHSRWFLLALCSFALAVTFRALDLFVEPYVSFGSHWLWHLFGATAVFCCIELVVRLQPGWPAGRRVRQFTST
jgi:predicted membrane channel-forming protein YqfA (hemolysin III family)